MKTNRGIVRTIILIAVAILLLSVFGIDLQEAVKEPLLKKNFQFIWTGTKNTWTNYIYNPIFQKKATSTGETATTPSGT